MADLLQSMVHYISFRKLFTVVNECALGTHDCDGNADCIDTPESFSCKCKSGWSDISANPKLSPGRTCKRGNFLHMLNFI